MTCDNMIKNSLEWADLSTHLKHQTNTKIITLENRDQVSRMIDNIGLEVTLLSKAEVLARRGHKDQATELLEKINNDIEMVEEFILIGALIG